MTYPISLPEGAKEALAVLHHETPDVWEFEMTSGKDNRLSRQFMLDCISRALDIVEKDWRVNGVKDGQNAREGALIISGRRGQAKFFSNGLDYENTKGDTSFFPTVADPMYSRILTFPIPVIAALNGHTFAAGFTLAMACDYRVMSSDKGWASMNEVFFGAPLPPSMAEIMITKLPNAAAVRKTFLEGHRWTAPELHAIGVVDVIAPGADDGVLHAARKLAEQKKQFAKTGVYGLMKADLNRRILDAGKRDDRLVGPADERRIALRKFKL